MKSLRRAVSALTVATLVTTAVPFAATAAEPSSGAVSPASPTATWQGQAASTSNPSGVCLPEDPACDLFALEVTPFSGTTELDVAIEASAEGDDYDMTVYGPDGGVVGGSASSGGNEAATVRIEDAGTYTVEVLAWVVSPGATYTGSATLRELASGATGPVAPGSVLWSYDAEGPQASVEVPLRVVAVGFEEGELDEEAVLGEIPDHNRVGVLTTYGGGFRSGDRSDLFGLDTLVNHGRAYYSDPTSAPLLPIEYRWKPEVVYADDAFATGLFETMVTNSEMGTHDSDQTTAYLTQYTETRGNATRVAAGGSPVTDPTTVRFVDGEKTEDWIAENGEQHLGFHTGKDEGVAGYTVFLINSWDAENVPAELTETYHHFRIDRPNPDTGEFAGIDWARIWGGRYRFMMVDLGAAPNPYEAESWGNRNRSALGSAAYDPPLWEYRANAPRPVTAVHLADGTEQAITPSGTWDTEQLDFMLGRTVNQAVNFRFFHAYLYEPRPSTGRFYLSDNVWHDEKAVLFPSILEKLYDQETALAGLSSLTPYFEFAGDVRYEYLDQADEHPEYTEDQAALDQAKEDGDIIVGATHVAMNTDTMMDYLDARPDRFLRGGACYTTVPTIQVVVEGHYAWALPIAAGIATNRDGVPWGFLNSVNDYTKWSGADRDETLAIAHPQAYTGTFTYTTIHEASHYLGLAHPHDTVGATRGEDGEPVYYDGFTWAFNSTASPTTYSHDEIVYSILDQESIARGHTSYYLQWTDEALAAAGAQLHADGRTQVSQLPARMQQLRVTAIGKAAEAERLFADFRFVDATFAAQAAWKAAAEFEDLALGNPVGSAELGRNTTKQLASEAGDCVRPTAAPATAPAPGGDTGSAAPLPTTGGGSLVTALGMLLLGMGGVAAGARRRLARDPLSR